MTNSRKGIASYQELTIFLNSLGNLKKILAIGEESAGWLELLRNESKNPDLFCSFSFENFHEVDTGERYDLTICLNFNVGKKRSVDLRRIQAICQVSDVVVFSSPSPLRTTSDQITHWPSYWAQIFEESFFYPSTYGRSLLWENKFVSPLLIQELIVCSRKAPGHKSDIPLDVVHPQAMSAIKVEKIRVKPPTFLNKFFMSRFSSKFVKIFKKFLPLKFRKKIKTWLLS